MPHFFNTFVYLHRKRLQQLYIAKQVNEQPDPEDDEESQDEADLADSMLSTPVKKRRKSRVRDSKITNMSDDDE